MTACIASSSIRKGRFLKVTSSLHVAECLPGEDWVGVSLNAASTGQAVTIVGPGGFADVRAGAAITAGDELEIIQLGSVAPLASGDKCGIALSTAAGNGSRVQVAVLPKQASGTGGFDEATAMSYIEVNINATVEVPDNTVTFVEFDTITRQAGSEFSLDTDTGIITVAHGGLFWWRIWTAWENSNVGQRYAAVAASTSTVLIEQVTSGLDAQVLGTGEQAASFGGVDRLTNDGETLRLFVGQNSGGGLDLEGGTSLFVAKFAP